MFSGVMASTMTTAVTSDKQDHEYANWVDDDATASAFDFVRFTMSDMNGVSRSKLVPRRHVNDKLRTGVNMCAGKSAVHPRVVFVEIRSPGHTWCQCEKDTKIGIIRNPNSRLK